MLEDINALAIKHIEMGHSPIPVPLGQKNPIIKGWQKLKVTKGNTNKFFPKGEVFNIAVLTGTISNNLIDVDVDHEMALSIAKSLLPLTQYIYGRKSKLSSHMFYYVPNGQMKTVQFRDAEHGCLIEYRGDGGCSICPESVHPSGEKYTSELDSVPATINDNSLYECVALVAVCSLIILEYPAEGSRHKVILGLSGLLCKAGYSESDIIKCVQLIAQIANDEEVNNRVQTAKHTYKGYKEGKNIAGFTILKDILGESRASLLSKWLNCNAKNEIKEDILSMVEEMNKSYAIVQVGGKCKVLEECTNPSTGNKSVNYHDINGFKQFYQNKLVVVGYNGKNKPIEECIVECWLKHEKRRSYKGVAFLPKEEDTPSGYYNLWLGFAVEPDPKSSCKLFLSHLFEVVCREDQEIYHWLLSWMAQAVQKPHIKTGTAIVLRGVRGSGKSLVAKYFGEIFAPHCKYVSQQHQLIGKFNSLLEDTLILVAEEAFWAGDKHGEGVLKDLITNDTIAIERKGYDVTQQKNYTRLIITSNNDWVIPAGELERRFMLLDVSDEYAQDEKYFKAIFEEMKNGGRSALLHLLMEYDYSNINLKKPILTRALMEQQIEGLDTMGKFLFSILLRGYIHPNSNHWPNFISTNQFLDIYKEHNEEIKNIDKSMQTQTGVSLKKYMKGSFKKTKRTLPLLNRQTGQVVNVNNKEQQLVYLLPTLSEARKIFENSTGISFKFFDGVK